MNLFSLDIHVSYYVSSIGIMYYHLTKQLKKRLLSGNITAKYSNPNRIE